MHATVHSLLPIVKPRFTSIGMGPFRASLTAAMATTTTTTTTTPETRPV